MGSRAEDSAGADGRRVAGGPTVRRLRVGDGAVLLPQMQPQLAFVSEVQVTFFTLERRKKPWVKVNADAQSTESLLSSGKGGGALHGMASPPCGSACGS